MNPFTFRLGVYARLAARDPSRRDPGVDRSGPDARKLRPLRSCAGSLGSWLRWNAGARVATLTLIPGYGSAYNGFNFNGYGKGQVLVTIPQRSKLEVHCENTASTKPHSCAIVGGPGARQPAAPGAATAEPASGVPPGKSASFSFRANAPATYRIASLVPGEERAGMWDVLTVSRSGGPSVTLLRR